MSKTIWAVETETINNTTKKYWTKVGSAEENEDGDLELTFLVHPNYKSKFILK